MSPSITDLELIYVVPSDLYYDDKVKVPFDNFGLLEENGLHVTPLKMLIDWPEENGAG